MQTEHETTVANLETWQETEWNVSDAVDRDAFKEKYGFDYEESFDEYK